MPLLPDGRRREAESTRPASWEWPFWLVLTAAATAAMFPIRGSLDKAHVAFVYLLIVLGASARVGRALGLTIAVVTFVTLNFFFVPPYHTLVVGDPLDWLVLVAFLATSAVAAQLLARARGEATEARRRADEIDSLSTAGAEALNAGRAEEALSAIAEVIRSTLGVCWCGVYRRDAEHSAIQLAAESGIEPLAGDGRMPSPTAPPPNAPPPTAPSPDAPPPDAGGLAFPSGDRLVEWVASHGRSIELRADGSTRLGDTGAGTVPAPDHDDARTLYLPLRVRDRTVGVLAIRHDAPIALDPARRRFLEALSYYAALGVERVRLVADAEHAEALRRADELKDALLASVSHDLRTPLTTIKALAQDIRREGDERAAIIEEEADRLNRFVADLLDLSRLAGGALTVTPEVNAAEDLVGAALQRISGTAQGREVAVHLDPTEPLALGRFDFVHSLRILVNLLENALKYSPPSLPVDVSVQRSGEWLDFRVADRGPGVAAPDRERIFEPFHRPAGTMPDTGGVGLGLSIARRLAEAQGGRVQYEERAGGGSVFTLRLPAAELRELEENSAARPL